MPLTLINEWIENEKKRGSTNPDRGILATATRTGIPHSRIVALREIVEEGILFFTQRDTRKVIEIKENPYGSMTIWLALQQRQIILDGIIKPLTLTENEFYWQTMSPERQLRFSAYAPTSSQPINSLDELDQKYQKLCDQYEDKIIPISDYYCGFRLIPNEIYFYTLGINSFSEVIKYEKNQNSWDKKLLSP